MLDTNLVTITNSAILIIMGILLDDLKLSREDDTFNDVCLTCTDTEFGPGGTIPASRTILSMRSQVFRKMFYGQFKESGSPHNVHLNFSSETIGSIVAYCYSDDAGTKSVDSSTTVNEAEVREMVRLRSAADFFALSELRENLTELLYSWMAKHPALVCTVVDELSAVGEVDGTFREICFHILKLKGETALLPADVHETGTGILACSPLVLAKILSEEVVGEDDDLIVRCLRAWEEPNKISRNGDENPELVEELSTRDGRKPEDQEPNISDANGCESQYIAAKEVADRVRLNLISPSTLVDLLSSKLFQKEQIYEAFKEQALFAEEHGTLMHETEMSPRNESRYIGEGATEANLLTTDSNAIDGTYCIVEGAGSTEANGVYTKHPSAVKDGVACYCMTGTFMDKPVTFGVFRTNDTWGTNKWWLKAFPFDDSSEDAYLYFALTDKLNADKVPRLTWKPIAYREDTGLNPPPCVFVL